MQQLGDRLHLQLSRPFYYRVGVEESVRTLEGVSSEGPGVAEKRQRAAAVQDATALFRASWNASSM